MTTLKVSDISARSPDMSDRDFDAFVADIKANGQLVPIWVRGDEVIDGRKRLAVCRQLGIEPKCVNLDPSQDAEAVSAALNLLRTHYSPSQRAAYGEEKAKAKASDAVLFRKDIPSKNRRDVPLSMSQAAAEVGVSRSAIAQARYIARTAAPEVTAAVKAGTLTLHAATQITDTMPKPLQPAAVAKVIEANKGKARHTPVAKVLDGVDVRKDRPVRKPLVEQMARALDAIEVHAEVIADAVDAAVSDVRRTQFAERLRAVRTLLSQSISRMEKVA